MFHKYLAIIFVVFISGGNAFPRTSAASDATKTCAFSEVFRKDGWAIPGFPVAGTPAIDESVPRKRVRAEMPNTYATKLIPAAIETTITRIGCGESGRLEIDDVPVGIVSLWSYDFEGRTFAYGVRYVDEWISGGARRQLASESQAIFYDLDGSGRFTLMRANVLVPTFVPEWAKKSKSVPSK